MYFASLLSTIIICCFFSITVFAQGVVESNPAVVYKVTTQNYQFLRATVVQSDPDCITFKTKRKTHVFNWADVNKLRIAHAPDTVLKGRKVYIRQRKSANSNNDRQAIFTFEKQNQDAIICVDSNGLSHIFPKNALFDFVLPDSAFIDFAATDGQTPFNLYVLGIGGDTSELHLPENWPVLDTSFNATQSVLLKSGGDLNGNISEQTANGLFIKNSTGKHFINYSLIKDIETHTCFPDSQDINQCFFIRLKNHESFYAKAISFTINTIVVQRSNAETQKIDHKEIKAIFKIDQQHACDYSQTFSKLSAQKDFIDNANELNQLQKSLMKYETNIGYLPQLEHFAKAPCEQASNYRYILHNKAFNTPHFSIYGFSNYLNPLALSFSPSKYISANASYFGIPFLYDRIDAQISLHLPISNFTTVSASYKHFYSGTGVLLFIAELYVYLESDGNYLPHIYPRENKLQIGQVNYTYGTRNRNLAIIAEYDMQQQSPHLVTLAANWLLYKHIELQSELMYSFAHKSSSYLVGANYTGRYGTIGLFGNHQFFLPKVAFRYNF